MIKPLYNRVYDCIETRLVKLACDLKYEHPTLLISDLRTEFHNHVADLQIRQSSDYTGRDTRLLVDAYRNVLKKYEVQHV